MNIKTSENTKKSKESRTKSSKPHPIFSESCMITRTLKPSLHRKDNEYKTEVKRPKSPKKVSQRAVNPIPYSEKARVKIQDYLPIHRVQHNQHRSHSPYKVHKDNYLVSKT